VPNNSVTIELTNREWEEAKIWSDRGRKRRETPRSIGILFVSLTMSKKTT